MRTLITIVLFVLLSSTTVMAKDYQTMMVMQPEHYPVIVGTLCQRDNGTRVLTTSFKSAHEGYTGTGTLSLLARESEDADIVEVLIDSNIPIGDVITRTYPISEWWSQELALDVNWADGFESDTYISGIGWAGDCPKPQADEVVDEPTPNVFSLYLPTINR